MAAHQPAPSDDLIELPLFPLNVVLFPGMRLPLHIFEERYKAMIGDCVEQEVPFGVVLIKEGQEAGDPAKPYRVGSAARILRVEHLEEGRMNILTLGEQRFRVVEITQWVPHVAGQVQFLPEELGEDPSPVVAEVSEDYELFRRNLAGLAGGWNAHAEAPQEPVRLSYSIAAALDLPAPIRQQLLDTHTARERLEQLLPLLKRVNEKLKEEVVKRDPFQGPRLN